MTCTNTPKDQLSRETQARPTLGGRARDGSGLAEVSGDDPNFLRASCWACNLAVRGGARTLSAFHPKVAITPVTLVGGLATSRYDARVDMSEDAGKGDTPRPPTAAAPPPRPRT